LKNIKNGTSKIHAHRTSDKRKTKTRILTSEKPNQKYTSSTGKKKKKPDSLEKIPHVSTTDRQRHSKSRTKLANSRQEAKPTANKLADSH
jgi:hypothetical protein